MRRKPSALETLFTSIGQGPFRAQYWPRRPIWSHGRVSRLTKLRDLETINGVLVLAAGSRIEIKAVLPGTLHETNEIPVLSGPPSAISLYDAGATIVYNGVERWRFYAVLITRTWRTSQCRKMQPIYVAKRRWAADAFR
jgi:hypothetical protein